MMFSRRFSVADISADRREFASRAAAIAGDSTRARCEAREWIQKQSSEQVVSHILALWQGEEVRRRRHFRMTIWVICASAVVMLILAVRLGIGAEAAGQFKPILKGLSMGCHVSFPAAMIYFRRRFPTDCQKGMARLLLEYPDPRLLGPMLEALSFSHRITDDEGEARAIRDQLIQKLTFLLSAVGHRDMPPLDAYQRRVLLAEIKRNARQLRKSPDSWNAHETAFLVAALGALERESAFGTAQPERVRQHEEKVLTQVAQARSADDGANGRQVREAAEDCLIRLRAQ